MSYIRDLGGGGTARAESGEGPEGRTGQEEVAWEGGRQQDWRREVVAWAGGAGQSVASSEKNFLCFSVELLDTPST